MANHVEFSHLSYRTTEQTLLDYFSNYGRVDKLVLHRDDQEQSLRKGSLAYADMDSVDRLMSQRPHSIDGRPIVLRRTMPLATYSKSHCISEYFGMNLTVNEIFISRLCSGETRDLFVNYFQRFGRIVNCRVFNSSSRHSQQMGYAFVRFEDYDSVGQLPSFTPRHRSFDCTFSRSDRIILTRPHVINAKVYHTRKCIPREYNYISSSIKPLSYSKPTWRHYAFGLINMETQAITYPSIPRCVTQTVPIVS